MRIPQSNSAIAPGMEYDRYLSSSYGAVMRDKGKMAIV
jgi:hypothetical protein